MSSFTFGGILYMSIKVNARSNAQPSKGVERIVAVSKPYSRKVVFTTALVWAAFLYVSAAQNYEQIDSAVSFMARMYGLSALAALYAVLSLGILRVYFPRLTINSLLMHASRGFGLSVFLFALLHALSAYIANLDGKLNAVLFLSTRHQVALALSTLAFLILFSMAVTSVDRIIDWMSFPRWKKLHRLVYAATIAVLFHAFLIGSHFVETGTLLPFLVMYGALSLLMLEAGAVYIQLQRKGRSTQDLSTRIMHVGLVLMVCAGMFVATTALQNPVDPHAGHDMSDGSSFEYSREYSIDGLQVTPQQFEAGQSTSISFSIKKSDSNEPEKQFYSLNEKLIHLIVVSDDLEEFHHLHPTMSVDGTFTTSFVPESNRTYYLYAEFAPEPTVEAISTAKITGTSVVELPAQLVPSSTIAAVDNFSLRMQSQRPISARKGNEFTFQIFDKNTNQPIKDLQPYLGQFGHLSIVRDDKQQYLHVHPNPELNTTSDGEISFMTWFPESGLHRLYLQFQHQGIVRTVQYTIEVVE